MSTWKSKPNPAVTPKVERHTLVSNAKTAEPERPAVITPSLRIDNEFDSGGDPYNQTGQFCVVSIKDESVTAKRKS